MPVDTSTIVARPNSTSENNRAEARQAPSAEPPPAEEAVPFRIAVFDAIASLPADWPCSDRADGQARCHVFQCADILEVWLDTIGKARGVVPVFVTVHDAVGLPVLFLALGIERRWGSVRVLGFLDGSVSDYSNPILFPGSSVLDANSMTALWKDITTRIPTFDVAILDKLSDVVGDLKNPIQLLGSRRMPESGHVMSVGGTLAEQLGRMPEAKRHTRYLRQLKRDHEVVFEVADNREISRTFLDTMIENKRRKFAETRVPGFELPGKLEFFVEMTRRLDNLSPVHLSAIRADDTIIASHWGLVYGDRFYALMISYADGVWRKYSPGRILKDNLIRWCHANGYRWFDFGIGDEIYKYEYCDIEVSLSIVERAMNYRGKAFLVVRELVTQMRATPLWQRLRPLKWLIIRRLSSKVD